MAKKLFGIDVAKLVAKSMPGMFNGTITSKTVGTRTAGAPSSGTNPTSASYTFKGFASKLENKSEDLVRTLTAEIVVLGATIKPVGSAVMPYMPKQGDIIALTDDPQIGARTCVINKDGVERDPAGATYICQVSVNLP